MSKPANLKQGKLVAGKKLATKQEAAVVKSQKAFRGGAKKLIKEGVLLAVPISPKKYITGAKLVNKTIKTIRSK